MRSGRESAFLGEHLHHSVDRLGAVHRGRFRAPDDLDVIDHGGIDLVEEHGVRDLHPVDVRLERGEVEQLRRPAHVHRCPEGHTGEVRAVQQGAPCIDIAG